METAEQKDYILRVTDVRQHFPVKVNFLGKASAYVRAVDGVSFDLERGKTIGVVGESGCGKTTLGKTILKLYEKTGGKIVFDGLDTDLVKKTDMSRFRCNMQLIFQDPYSSLPPRMTVGAIISEPVLVHKIVPRDEVNGYVHRIMERCGLQRHYFDRYPHEFSGGQRQRICIARALSVRPKLVICDEPVSALDVSIQAQIINLLKKLQREEGMSYIFISHDLSVVKYISDDIAVMYLGNMVETGPAGMICGNPLHPYTRALFSAVPKANPHAKTDRIMLEGDLPSPADPPSGCKFHTRCQYCTDRCKTDPPAFAETEKGHRVACHLYASDEKA